MEVEFNDVYTMHTVSLGGSFDHQQKPHCITFAGARAHTQTRFEYMWTCAKTKTKNPRNENLNDEKKNYDDILPVTVNIKVASKCGIWKKTWVWETKTKTTNSTQKWLWLCQFYSLNDSGGIAIFFSELFFQLILSLLTKFQYVHLSTRKTGHYSFFHTTIHLADINKMSAPEHENNGEFEHWLCEMIFRWSDCYLLIVPLDFAFSPPLFVHSQSHSHSYFRSIIRCDCVCVCVALSRFEYANVFSSRTPEDTSSFQFL